MRMIFHMLLLSACVSVLEAGGCTGGEHFGTEDDACGKLQHVAGICRPEDYPYKPGGKTVHIDPINAPCATIQENGIANIGKYGGLGIQVADSFLDIAEAAEKGFTVAKKLAASLSVWGAVFGAMATTSPSASDILDGVNKAFVDLTNDINDAFVNMQGYVDQKVLDAQKDRWDDEFSFYYNTFASCLDYHIVSEEKVNTCMEGVEAPSRNDKNVFMDYYTYIDNNDWQPSIDEIKHMEVQFLVFRDYANLRVMMLLTLISSYQNQTDDYHQSMTHLYYQFLVDETDLYIKYAHFCYDHIKTMYNSDYDFFVSTQDCHNYHKVCEGWPSIYTGGQMDCTMRFNRMFMTTETCYSLTYVRHDGKRPPKVDCKVYNWNYLANSMETKIDSINRWAMNDEYYYEFNNKMQLQIKNFWEPSIINSLPKLKEIHDEAVRVMNEKFPAKFLPQADEYMTQGRKEFVEMVRTTILERKLERMEEHRKPSKRYTTLTMKKKDEQIELKHETNKKEL